ncbi:hypothetical protein NITHO_3430010 [Nitrolancea hollandica Lb]|uniref:Uncharacterized protein n=1 Tax=Nitrolancea hollandica Lb TaxID=1129897 RepID=I4EIF3_9BACT|nr:hypothetical protein NITHO_3430010 [Nitrolancea hollandica Lb]
MNREVSLDEHCREKAYFLKPGRGIFRVGLGNTHAPFGTGVGFMHPRWVRDGTSGRIPGSRAIVKICPAVPGDVGGP